MAPVRLPATLRAHARIDTTLWSDSSKAALLTTIPAFATGGRSTGAVVAEARPGVTAHSRLTRGRRATLSCSTNSTLATFRWSRAGGLNAGEGDDGRGQGAAEELHGLPPGHRRGEDTGNVIDEIIHKFGS
jgi:hypothetical protein